MEKTTVGFFAADARRRLWRTYPLTMQRIVSSRRERLRRIRSSQIPKEIFFVKMSDNLTASAAAGRAQGSKNYGDEETMSMLYTIDHYKCIGSEEWEAACSRHNLACICALSTQNLFSRAHRLAFLFAGEWLIAQLFLRRSSSCRQEQAGQPAILLWEKRIS